MIYNLQVTFFIFLIFFLIIYNMQMIQVVLILSKI